jgi:hypothetical protein
VFGRKIEPFFCQRILDRDDELISRGGDAVSQGALVVRPRAVLLEAGDGPAKLERIAGEQALEVLERVAMFGRRRGGRCEWRRRRRRRRGVRRAELVFQPIRDLEDGGGQPVEIVAAIPLTCPASGRFDQEEPRAVGLNP